MSGNQELLELNEQVKDELRTQYHRVIQPTSAKRAWERLLTSHDRERLGGDLAIAYQDGLTIGIWRRLKGGSAEKAVIELAYGLGFANEATRIWVLRELGEDVATAIIDIPAWDIERRELTFRGTIIRRVARPKLAIHVVKVLDAFQAQAWPRRIDDPLPGGRNQVRLHAAIRSLNDGLGEIKFFADGTGEGVCWRIAHTRSV